MELSRTRIREQIKDNLRRLAIPVLTLGIWCNCAQAESWTQVATQFTVGQAILLLTDGRVLMGKVRFADYSLRTRDCPNSEYIRGGGS